MEPITMTLAVLKACILALGTSFIGIGVVEDSLKWFIIGALIYVGYEII